MQRLSITDKPAGIYLTYTDREGGRAINIFVYASKTAETQKLLCEKTAEIHAAAILAKLEKLSCSKEQKLRLLEEIKKAAT